MIKRTAGNWAEWPECPQCHERREARCPVCFTRGTDFRVADFEEPEDAEAGSNEADVLLLCSTCDEPFMPEFYRCCAACGHDFGVGIEQPETVPEELNKRVTLVIVGMVLLCVGLLAYFALVFQ